MLLQGHGGPEQFVLRPDYRDPVAGPQDAIVRVRACSLNYHDIFTRNGMPGIRIPMPIVIGIDVAGEIVEVGADVTGFKVGDRVLADPYDRENAGLLGETFDGGLAELVRVPVSMLVPIGGNVSFADAAALPVAYGTAYRMMVARGKVAAGEKVLILGASGGVGTCCVQLAKLAGAEVIACASSESKLETLRALGADHTIDYVRQDWVAECRSLFGKARAGKPGSGGVDVVVNFTGGDTWTKSLRVLRHNGRLLTCGATAGYDPKEDIRFIWTFELNIIGSDGWSRDDLITLLDLVGTGRLNPVLHPERFPLDRAPEALSLLEQRQVLGKVIVEP